MTEQTTIAVINISTVKQFLDTDKDLILIDVRELEEWDNGYIPGAIHISKNTITRGIEKKVPNKDAEIILYCGGGMRSLTSAQYLQEMGYKNVSSMTGGITAWRNASYPVVDD